MCICVYVSIKVCVCVCEWVQMCVYVCSCCMHVYQFFSDPNPGLGKRSRKGDYPGGFWECPASKTQWGPALSMVGVWEPAQSLCAGGVTSGRFCRRQRLRLSAVSTLKSHYRGPQRAWLNTVACVFFSGICLHSLLTKDVSWVDQSVLFLISAVHTNGVSLSAGAGRAGPCPNQQSGLSPTF